MRVHPVTVLFSLTRYFWVLAAPIIRAVLAAGFDVSGAFRGSVIDISVMLFLVSRAIIKYLFTYIYADENGITVKSGAVMKKRITMRHEDMTCLELDRNPFISLFHCAKLTVYCDASKSPIIRAYCTEVTAKLIETTYTADLPEDRAVINTPFRAFLTALFHTGSRSGLLFLSALFSFTGIVTGKTASMIAQEIPSYAQRYAESFAADIPALLLVAGIVLLTLKIVSVAVGTVLLHGRYYPDRAVVHDKPFRRMTLISLCGVIAVKSVFLPGRTTITGISGGFDKSGYTGGITVTSAGQVKVRKATFHKSAAPAVIMPFLLFSGALFVIICFLSGIIYGIGISPWIVFLLPVPFLLRMIYGAVASVISRISADEELITARFMKDSLMMTCSVSKSKVGKVRLSQTPFAMMRDTADIRIYATGLKEKVVVKNIGKGDAVRIFGQGNNN